MSSANDQHNYTYILRCADGTFYCGWTNDLEKRLAAHNAGTASKYTAPRRPVEIVYTEQFATKQEAMSREYHIKQLTRQQKIELIEHGKPDLFDASSHTHIRYILSAKNINKSFLILEESSTVRYNKEKRKGLIT